MLILSQSFSFHHFHNTSHEPKFFLRYINSYLVLHTYSNLQITLFPNTCYLFFYPKIKWYWVYIQNRHILTSCTMQQFLESISLVLSRNSFTLPCTSTPPNNQNRNRSCPKQTTTSVFRVTSWISVRLWDFERKLRVKWEIEKGGRDSYKLSILMAVTNKPLCQNAWPW
jgi:hypothetical protein